MKPQSGKAMFALTTFIAGWLTVATAQQAGKAASTAKTSKSPVQEITLPEYPLELPPGPNLQAFQQHCLLCHSARYVTMQPRFSRTVWEKEVKKMVDTYGAPITAEEQPKIVEYLVAIKGPMESK
ncbi:MAG TPA: cytochrome c [Candidatus Angelobacter sp.]|jgi:cytochrome c5|nr:cytochrome c [Candidatus Angelobacter sp.]